MAVGIVQAALDTDRADALALLRSHAVITDQDVEDTAEAFITGTLHPDQLSG